MSNAILLVVCIAAEGFLVYFFQIARELKSNRLPSRRDPWNESRSNIAPIQFVTPGSITEHGHSGSLPRIAESDPVAGHREKGGKARPQTMPAAHNHKVENRALTLLSRPG
jgi:hypothetical protein